MLGEYVALGNVGSAQLDAGDVDAAIESLRKSVDGLRRINAPYGLEFRLSTLAVALAWRGDDVDILPLAREAFDHLRLLGVTFAPLMAAALQHARRDDPRRAVLLTGYAYSKLPLQSTHDLIALPMQQRVRDRAAAEHPAATVEDLAARGRAPDRGAGSGDRVRRRSAGRVALSDRSVPIWQGAATTARVRRVGVTCVVLVFLETRQRPIFSEAASMLLRRASPSHLSQRRARH